MTLSARVVVTAAASAVAILAPTLLVGCAGSSSDGELASWRVDPDEDLSGQSRGFTALVTRLECAGGVTGEVLPPRITIRDTGITVTFDVARNEDGDYTCESNDWVPYDVDLGEPLGERKLIDGHCSSGGPASSTPFCTIDEGVRYLPPR